MLPVESEEEPGEKTEQLAEEERKNREKMGLTRRQSSKGDREVYATEAEGITTKVFSAEPEAISPLMLGKSKEVDPFSLDLSVLSIRNSSSGAAAQKSLRNSTGASPLMRPLSGSWKASPSLLPMSNFRMSPSLRPMTSYRRSPSLRAFKMSPSLRPLSTYQISPSLRPMSSNFGDESWNWNGAPDRDAILAQQEYFKSLLTEIEDWIKRERAMRLGQLKAKETHHHGTSVKSDVKKLLSRSLKKPAEHLDGHGHSKKTREKDIGDLTDPTSLDELSSIVDRGLVALADQLIRLQQTRLGHRRSSRKLRKRASTTAASSEGGFKEEEFIPTCEEILDNSKTMSYTGRNSVTGDLSLTHTRTNEAWFTFKYEIVRLAHTLRLRGWRKVPLNQSSEIDVERLSGALTNAVYIVSPPASLTDPESGAAAIHNRPTKLLLRIYGPNAEDLIDRESELRILRRLARQNIGPCLLGTFTNGRFEEYLHAKALKPRDLRTADTSVQIAKRMRELHDGIELLDCERENGPFVWQNWDKWVNKCRKAVTFLDQRAENATRTRRKSSLGGILGGSVYVCGVPWSQFEATYDKVRKWLKGKYGGSKSLKDQLIFAHNDTQYGNILRIEPPGESPLLLPQNVHKQLIVIDFEYANANVPGLEFANHFTEWCYDYHDLERSWACNIEYYPTIEQQERFIRAYVLHNPKLGSSASSQTNTPVAAAMRAPPSANASQSPLTPLQVMGDSNDSTSSSLSSHYAEMRNPVTNETILTAERQEVDEAKTKAEIKRHMYETKLWRACNSAQWVAWGIMQARIPGIARTDSFASTAEKPFSDLKASNKDHDAAQAERSGEFVVEEEEEDVDFDYLSYARDRALFFWADCLQLGFINESDLPCLSVDENQKGGSIILGDVRAEVKAKIVPY